MKDLLSQVNKTPYQTYTIENGLDRVRVKVPVSNVNAFEQAFAAAIESNLNTQELLLIVEEFAGSRIGKS